MATKNIRDFDSLCHNQSHNTIHMSIPRIDMCIESALVWTLMSGPFVADQPVFVACSITGKYWLVVQVCFDICYQGMTLPSNQCGTQIRNFTI